MYMKCVQLGMAKRVPVPISTARKQLFQLADLVRKSGDDTVVVLEQRGGVEPVAMVREARLAYLESRAEELSKITGKPFRLQGSLSTALDDEALERALKDLRSAWVAPLPQAVRRASRRPAAKRRQ